MERTNRISPQYFSRVFFKPFVCLVLAGITLFPGGARCAEENGPFAELDEALQREVPPHPRLFLHAGDEKQKLEEVRRDPLMRDALGYLERSAEAIMQAPPPVREMKGRRLLMTSRLVLKRVLTLATAYRFLEEPRYAERAKQEMLAAAGFRNWNPSHFLDVAEMTAAMAIGYDWLYETLDEDSRETIRDAIVDKALKVSVRRTFWWIDADNNWNQVCHGGLALGAMAVFEDEPELARQIIRRTVGKLPIALETYAPDGAYSEGPGYWEYGTTYNVLLLAGLESVFGTDFGLSEYEGFMESARYHLHSAGPSGWLFNYGDNKTDDGLSPTMWWFAAQLNEPALLWRERESLKQFFTLHDDLADRKDRFFPLLFVWPAPLTDLPAPTQLFWTGKGLNPVSLYRTQWGTPAAGFLGIKGGSPSENHAHMDSGSFVMEADGVRWAHDLNRQKYGGLEEAGVDLWNRGQDGERWEVFRWGSFSHNTLVVNGEQQRVKGHAPIERFSHEPPAPFTVIDLTTIYEGQLAQAKRGAMLFPDGSVLIQDEITTPDRETTEVRWAMVTEADVEAHSNTAYLRQDNEVLEFHILSPADAEVATYEIADPPKPYDEPNPGKRMIGFTVNLPANTEQRLVVLLKASGGAAAGFDPPPLEEWGAEKP